MARKKKKTKTTATKSRSATQSRRRRSTPDLFPKTLIIEWSDGTTEEMPFANPTESAAGNLNAWSGNKIVRDGEMLRINCNVTKVRG